MRSCEAGQITPIAALGALSVRNSGIYAAEFCKWLLGLNLWAVPRYGMTGAAWTAVVCQAVTVAGGWALAERQFPVRVPMGQLVRCVLAVVPMSAALIMIRFPLNWFGLMAAVLMGAAIYGAAAFALDVGECRSLGWEMLHERLRGRVAVPTS